MMYLPRLIYVLSRRLVRAVLRPPQTPDELMDWAIK